VLGRVFASHGDVHEPRKRIRRRRIELERLIKIFLSVVGFFLAHAQIAHFDIPRGILWRYFDGLLQIGFRRTLISLPEKSFGFVNVSVGGTRRDGL